jgi:hypothetical protein
LPYFEAPPVARIRSAVSVCVARDVPRRIPVPGNAGNNTVSSRVSAHEIMSGNARGVVYPRDLLGTDPHAVFCCGAEPSWVPEPATSSLTWRRHRSSLPRGVLDPCRVPFASEEPRLSKWLNPSPCPVFPGTA